MRHPSFTNIAHRGASGYAPENTLAAFDRALDLGAGHVEFDVHFSADGLFWCFNGYFKTSRRAGTSFDRLRMNGSQNLARSW